jgi:hypothetical protein
MKSRTILTSPTPVNQSPEALNPVSMDETRAPRAEPADHKGDSETKYEGSVINEHKSRRSRPTCSDGSDTEHKDDDDHCNSNTKDDEPAHSPRQTRQLTQALQETEDQPSRLRRTVTANVPARTTQGDVAHKR